MKWNRVWKCLKDKRLMTMVASVLAVSAQNPELQQKVAEVKLPGGPGHVDSQTIDGVSKQLAIVIANSNYQHL
jgi:hypothetical protein